MYQGLSTFEHEASESRLRLDQGTGPLGHLEWPLDALGYIPDDVAQHLSATLCSAAHVLFVSGSAGADQPWARKSDGSWTCATRGFELTYTSIPQKVRSIFWKPFFNWRAGGQIAWLFSHSQNPPHIEPADLDDVLATKETRALPFGSIGWLRAGADGASAELFVRDVFIQRAIVRALR
jgi:hypothetical protein